MASQASGKTAKIATFPADDGESLRREIERLRLALEHETDLRRHYETQLRQLSASLPVVIWMSDTNRKITFVSDNWYDMTGSGPGQLDDWPKWIVDADRDEASARMAASIRARDRVAIEFRIHRADGSVGWVLALGAPRFTEAGRYDGYVGAMIDISERRAAVDALQHAEARLSLALESTKVGVWDWDVTTGKVWLSDSALAIQGFEPGEVEGDAGRMGDVVHPEDAPELRRVVVTCLKGEQPFVNIEHRLARKGGGWVWVAERARVIERDANGRALRMIGTRTDMTERRKRDERLRWLAAHDVLTELPNRARFQELLLAAMREADARGGSMGLLMLDIDWFKTVNDSYGHDAGDALLKAIARRLRAAFPKPATAARLGGDEFAVILPDVSDLAELQALARKAAFADTRTGDLRSDTSASVGAAFYPDHATTAAELVKHADIALYRAKDRGRSRAVIYSPDL